MFHCADAFATIVVVDAHEGKPTRIPWTLQPSTEEEHLRLEVCATDLLASLVFELVLDVGGKKWALNAYGRERERLSC